MGCFFLRWGNTEWQTKLPHCKQNQEFVHTEFSTSASTPVDTFASRIPTPPTTLTTNEHVALSEVANLSAAEMLKFVREHGLEGVVAKRSDSVYQPGMRTGLWSKFRINLGQEFVLGGYVPSNLGVDSLVVGFTVGTISSTHHG